VTGNARATEVPRDSAERAIGYMVELNIEPTAFANRFNNASADCGALEAVRSLAVATGNHSLHVNRNILTALAAEHILPASVKTN
jgi:hypothetical protein